MWPPQSLQLLAGTNVHLLQFSYNFLVSTSMIFIYNTAFSERGDLARVERRLLSFWVRIKLLRSGFHTRWGGGEEMDGTQIHWKILLTTATFN